MGGIAGGEKHVAKGIFFKLCVDLHELYGGAEWAAKVANLELLGLNAYVLASQSNSTLSQLRTPMMALIDYKYVPQLIENSNQDSFLRLDQRI